MIIEQNITGNIYINSIDITTDEAIYKVYHITLPIFWEILFYKN